MLAVVTNMYNVTQVIIFPLREYKINRNAFSYT